MGLNSALVDRARCVWDEPVAGASTAEVHGTWFRCRVSGAPKSGGDPTREGASATLSLLTGSKDSEGEDLLIRSSDRVEIDSAQFGQGTYGVAGFPSAMRKKRTIIGWSVKLGYLKSTDTRGFDW
jgi:hypothetical protein